jgi:N-acetylmuramoyl-L-alanine amidase
MTNETTCAAARTNGTWNVRSRVRSTVRGGAAARRRTAITGLLALFVLLLSGRVEAQRAASGWTLSDGRASSAVGEVRTAGYAAVPATSLRALGATVESVRAGTRVRLGGSELLLQAGSPFFTANGGVRQLIDPPYEAGGQLYVPVQLLVDHLPSLVGADLAVDLGARTIRRVVAASAAATPPRGEVAAAPATRPASPPAGTAQGTSSAPRPAASPSPSSRPAAEPPPSRPAAEQPAARPAATPPQTRAPAAASRAPSPASARRLIVIDAGHGGVDPGAVGPSGVREKDVALAVARRLAAVLREDPTLEVRMTRERDTLIALTDRGRMANRWRGDGQDALFMSIHTNAHDHRSARGFETYFLSEARTDDARAVAQRENAAQRFENPSQRLDPLSFIMLDLRQNKYLRDSSAWAAMVQDRLASVHPGPNRGVKQAGFVVLNGAFMPAVLVELGFITHPEEERMLASPEYQARLARQLAAAVKDFFQAGAASAAAR